MVLHPIEDASNDKVWRAGDGAKYSTSGLMAFCMKLLDTQVLAEA